MYRYGKLRVLSIVNAPVSSYQLNEEDIPSSQVMSMRVSSGNINGYLQINTAGEVSNIIANNCLGTIIYLVP